jgi:ferredoxin/flavodoxin
MENPERRTFLKAGGAGLAGLALAGMSPALPATGLSEAQVEVRDSRVAGTTSGRVKPVNPKGRALVLWYSQTGNTARTGRCIAKTLEGAGFSVKADDYRKLLTSDFDGADLIVAGSPVYYYDVPENFKTWLANGPSLSGKRVGAYVTYGGEGGNQHNTAVTLLGILAGLGGFPLGFETFGNMSTFAITWSTGNTGRIMRYSHLPDAKSYARMLDFALGLSDAMEKGRTPVFGKRRDYREWLKGPVSIRATKALINRHVIDKDRCVECGLCVRFCPVSAIDLPTGNIDGKACIACLGCVNNCPEQAVTMEFLFMKVKGFKAFRQEKNIIITEPEQWFAQHHKT